MRATAAVCAAMFFLGACETLKGAGRDVESAGEEIDEEIDEEDSN